MSSAENQWTRFYTEDGAMMYPAEAVIRIFKGKYPKMSMPRPKAGDSILDIGCGDGRHFPLFASLGMKMAGSEITHDIVQGLRSRFSELGLEVDLRVGKCAKLPWIDNERFDYALAWNSCYYMHHAGRFEDHVAEIARVIKPGGWLICSVPRKDCFIFDGADFYDMRYPIVLDDYFGFRNGQRMRCFISKNELQQAFEHCFTDFSHATIDIDMFGLSYTWYVFTARKRIP